jgi:autotransporter-associated beta strand protein
LGGSVIYSNATINKGVLQGAGTHLTTGSSAFNYVSNLGTLVVAGTLNETSLSNASSLVVASGGVLNNYSANLNSFDGTQLTVNSGGTLNIQSSGPFVTLGLQQSVFVDNGVVTGTTEAYSGSTVEGSGVTGPLYIQSGATYLVSTSAALRPSSLTVSSGTITGSGQTSVAATIHGAYLMAASSTSSLTWSGNLSGDGGLFVGGAGTVDLAGTNSYIGGTSVSSGTLMLQGASSLLAGSSLMIGSSVAAGASFDLPTSANTQPSISPVPEPGTLGLLAGALLVAMLAYRMRPSHGG